LWGTSPLNVARNTLNAAVASLVKGGSSIGSTKGAAGTTGGVALAGSEDMTAGGRKSQMGFLRGLPLIAREFQITANL
jgi:hypothetical protein